MSAALYDVPGPAARRRAAVASVITVAVVVALLGLALKRFADKGQLSGDRWELFGHWSVWRFLLGGLRNTLAVALVAMVLSLLLGAVLAFGRLSRRLPSRLAAGGYVELFRALPLLLLIFFSARVFPRYGIDISVFWILVVALVAYNGAVIAEIVRAGILSLERGQREAALAVGLTDGQAMRLVVLPQALRRMAPALVGQLVTLLKDTSLGFVLPYEELLRRGQITGEFANAILPSLLVIAAMYLTVNLALGRVAKRIERRADRPIYVLAAELE